LTGNGGNPQIAVGKEFVREKNEHMAVNAERWVIANIRSKNIEDLVKRARGTSTTTLQTSVSPLALGFAGNEFYRPKA
jgi:hypothetical protein